MSLNGVVRWCYFICCCCVVCFVLVVVSKVRLVFSVVWCRYNLFFGRLLLLVSCCVLLIKCRFFLICVLAVEVVVCKCVSLCFFRVLFRLSNIFFLCIWLSVLILIWLIKLFICVDRLVCCIVIRFLFNCNWLVGMVWVGDIMLIGIVLFWE